MKTIYVQLLEEGTAVWRPVEAVQVGPDLFQIPEKTKVPEDEIWEFQPGSLVKCRERKFKEPQGLIREFVAYVEA